MSDNTSSASEQQDVEPSLSSEGTTDEVRVPRDESQDSATDIINIPETKSQLLVIVGIFSLTGFAAGLAGYFALGAFNEGTGNEFDVLFMTIMLLVAFISLTVTFPILGAILGVLSSTKLQLIDRVSNEQALVTVGVGVLVGTSIALILAMIIIGSQIPATGGEGGGADSGGSGVSELFVDIVLISIATAVAGVGAAYINLNYDTIRR